MNIIYILNITSMAGGGNKSLMSLIEKVNEHHNIVAVTTDRAGMYAVLSKKGINVESFPFIFNVRPNLSSFKDLLLFIPRLIKRKLINRIAEYRLINISKKFSADVIHTNTSVNEIGYNVAKKLNIPHVMHIREYGDKDHGFHIYGIKKRIKDLKSWNVFITRDIAKYYDCIESENSIVVYNPVVKNKIVSMKWPRKNFFLYAGRIDSSKGISDLIQSYIKYCKISKSNATPLIIAGECRSESQVKLKKQMIEILDHHNLTNKVQWIGEVENISDYMIDAKAVIVPSLFEGFGRVMPESQSNGALVIGRDTGGTHEQFENGVRLTQHEIGIRFKNNDELSKAMIRVDNMSEPEYRKYVENAQYTIRTLYTQEASSNCILNLYDKIISA